MPLRTATGGLHGPGAGGPADRFLHHAPDHPDLPGRAAHQGGRTCPRNALDDDPAAGDPGGLRRRAGWVGIPEALPRASAGLLPNWFHEFVGGTLLGASRERWPSTSVPLLTSLVVALGGLTLGWLVYRDVKAGATDPLAKPLGPLHPVLKNKYYFDELYRLRLRPPGDLAGGDLHLAVDGPHGHRRHPALRSPASRLCSALSCAITSTSRSSTASGDWLGES